MLAAMAIALSRLPAFVATSDRCRATGVLSCCSRSYSARALIGPSNDRTTREAAAQRNDRLGAGGADGAPIGVRAFATRSFAASAAVERVTDAPERSRNVVVTGGGDAPDLGRAKETPWTYLDSERLYRISRWGAPYVSVNPQGHVCIRESDETAAGASEIDLVELIHSLKKQNVQFPLVVRFPNIVNDRIVRLQRSFGTAISNLNYKSYFHGVFPIKCNHDPHLVDEVVQFNSQGQFGLEVGSKSELLIAMAKLMKSGRPLLICNGYKDKVYMECALHARRLGINAIIVIEKVEELDSIVSYSKALGIRPSIGIRAKLSTKHNGHWGGTSGDHGKFGLNVNDIVRAAYKLRQEKMLDCLHLLHFHIGSQISSLSIVKEAMREGSHLYCELALMGAPLIYIDVGGGLGIDYDGTQRQTSLSTNYTMQNYANDVIGAVVDACNLKGVPHPVVISESGRALVSHHSVLVFDVVSGNQPSEQVALENLARCSTSRLRRFPAICAKASNDVPHKAVYLLSTFYTVYQSVSDDNYWEAFNDAKQFKLEAGNLFKLGCMTLEQHAQALALYEAVCHKVLAHVKPTDTQDELRTLRKSVGSVYHVNMSLFRSAPDLWAIDQIFPIVPLQRLNEKPTVEATLADLTCDSDGKMERFVGANGEISGTLPLHLLREGEQYFLGIFLAGAYQEVMGSAHNLFGTTNTVYVRAKAAEKDEFVHKVGKDSEYGCQPGGEDGQRYVIDRVIKGQTTAEVLESMHYNAEEAVEKVLSECNKAVEDGRLSQENAQSLLGDYKSSLESYTYLTK